MFDTNLKFIKFDKINKMNAAQRDLIEINNSLRVVKRNSRRQITPPETVRETLIIISLLRASPCQFIGAEDSGLVRHDIARWAAPDYSFVSKNDRVCY